MFWTNRPPNKVGFYFMSYTQNPKDGLIKIEEIKELNGRLYGKSGYVDNEIYKNFLFSNEPLEIPKIL